MGNLYFLPVLFRDIPDISSEALDENDEVREPVFDQVFMIPSSNILTARQIAILTSHGVRAGMPFRIPRQIEAAANSASSTASSTTTNANANEVLSVASSVLKCTKTANMLNSNMNLYKQGVTITRDASSDGIASLPSIYINFYMKCSPFHLSPTCPISAYIYFKTKISSTNEITLPQLNEGSQYRSGPYTVDYDFNQR